VETVSKQHQIRRNNEALTIAAVCGFDLAVGIHLLQYIHYFIGLHECCADSFKEFACSDLTGSVVEYGVIRINPNQIISVL
jgi:hypothetical protein